MSQKQFAVECEFCDGCGERSAWPCGYCKGTGKVEFNDLEKDRKDAEVTLALKRKRIEYVKIPERVIVFKEEIEFLENFLNTDKVSTN